MSGWNHRIIRKQYDGEYWYTMHEVYYDDDGNPDCHTQDPVGPRGDCIEDVRELCEWMLKACDSPVLEWSEKDGYKEVRS